MPTLTTSKYCDVCKHLTHGRDPQCDQCNCTADYVTTLTCRCCNKPVAAWLDNPIHTMCIAKHWGKHYRGRNASRCSEFGKGKA